MNQKKSLKKYVKPALQVAFTFILLFLAFRKVDWAKLYDKLGQVDFLFALVGVISLNIGQLIGSIRQRIMMRREGIYLTAFQAWWVYYRGMLFNLALPGGVSGDAWRGWHLGRLPGRNWKSVAVCLLFERLGGLMAMLGWVAILIWVNPISDFTFMLRPWVEVARIASLVYLFAIVGFVLYPWAKQSLPYYLRAILPASIGVQAFHMVSVLALVWSLGGREHLDLYLLGFAISSLAAVLPISIGGIGLREYVLVNLPWILPLADANLGLGFALLFNFLYVVSTVLAAVVPNSKNDIRVAEAGT